METNQFCFSQVSLASQPALEPWLGAREWALRNMSGSHGWISRQDYEENGGEYLSEHCSSNNFIPMRLSKPAARSNELLFSATEHTHDVTASTTGLNTDVACDPNSGTSGVTVEQQTSYMSSHIPYSEFVPQKLRLSEVQTQLQELHYFGLSPVRQICITVFAFCLEL